MAQLPVLESPLEKISAYIWQVIAPFAVMHDSNFSLWFLFGYESNHH